MKKIINIVGARPNFMKIAPLMEELKKNTNFESLLLHTGQHYDDNMSKVFFEELNIPRPDIYLGVGSASHAKQTARIMEKFDEVCDIEKPDAILVVGDVNSTLACTLVASKKNITTIHLEAGLRSFDRTMPEEINRLVTDTLSDILLIPSLDAKENLLKEGIPETKIYFVGNIMIDTLIRNLPVIKKSDILTRLEAPQNYALITLHRPSNVDNPILLRKIIYTFLYLQQDIPLIFPLHPRTLKNLKKLGLYSSLSRAKHIILSEPLGYIDFQNLMLNAQFVITDSGGIQEETTYLGIPCLTLRKNTERPITITEGSNLLIGEDMHLLLESVHDILNNKWKKGKIPKFWDGKTAKRVVKVLQKSL